MDEEKIKRQAKEIMDEFMKALEKLPQTTGEFGSERTESLREGKAQKPNKEFKKRLLQNAPKSKDDYLVMEKKKW